MSFFPSNFELPKANNGYMKIQDGENKIRILSDPIVGWEEWRDKKPVRYRYENKPLKPIDEKSPPRLFSAFIVWDYSQNKILILEIVQASVMKKLDALSKDCDWGSLFRYDVKIKKLKKNANSTELNNTFYEVNPLPHKDIDPMIREEYEKTPINLEELFRGEDPFKSALRTKAFWQMVNEPAAQNNECISIQEMAYIEDMIASRIEPADAGWKSNALNVLKITSFAQLPKARHAMVLKRIEDKITALLADEIPF